MACERCGSLDTDTIYIDWTDDLSRHEVCRDCEKKLMKLITEFFQ